MLLSQHIIVDERNSLDKHPHKNNGHNGLKMSEIP